MESKTPYRTLQPGDMLNWYRIERILGRGGFGVIYLATDTNLDHQVAIKEYIPGDVATRSSDSNVEPITKEHGEMFRWGMDRFIKEARNLVKFKHPNIVRVMSVFQENNTAYMVMEFEEGQDLRSYLRKPGVNSEQSLKQLILPISQGLAEVHRHGFIHRDIKPANILVRNDGTPVLLDFGSARNASKFTQQSLTALVSVGYAPLEQYNSDSDEQQGPWTDIYALGGTLYNAITGKDPVESTRRGAALLNGGTDPLISAEYLGEGRYSKSFLKAIDWAMQFAISDRPQTLSDWIPALLGSEQEPDLSKYNPASSVGSNANFANAERLENKAMLDDFADATQISRDARNSKVRQSERNRDSSVIEGNSGVRVLALFTLMLSVVALGLWFVTGDRDSSGVKQDTASLSSDKQQDVVSNGSSNDTSAQDGSLSSDADNSAAAQARVQTGEELRISSELAEAERLTTDAVQKNVVELAVKESERITEKSKAAAEEAAAAKELVAERQAALAKANEEAAAEAEQAKVRAAQSAARQAAARKERRLKQTITAAQNSLSVGDLSAAQTQLANAQQLDSDDARVQTLAFAVQSAQAVYDQPVSDADFDTVTRMFDGLRQAIESQDLNKMDRLAVSSQQSSIFRSLMQNFELVDVSISNIRVRNADKSITAVLRIDSMVRDNGDRATPSDKYATRTIVSRRVNGGWSKIDW